MSFFNGLNVAREQVAGTVDTWTAAVVAAATPVYPGFAPRRFKKRRLNRGLLRLVQSYLEVKTKNA